MRCSFVTAIVLVALAGGEARADRYDEAMAAAGEVLFRHHCQACHSPDPTANAFGPQLHGLVGRAAGTAPRFEYSDALRDSGIVWTEANLRAWLADNDGFIPGTRMPHVAITDGAEQDFLLAFIRTLAQ